MHFSIGERIKSKIKTLLYPLTAPNQRRLLNNTDFTIISNNCWGGIVYEHFGLMKNTPTAGVYFYAEDYIKFVSNLRYYTACEMKMTTYENSKYKKELEAKNEQFAPIGVLDDVEVVFLHYRDPQEAKEKWKRRVSRINWDNMILKFSYMNGCTDEHIDAFERITGVKKVLFVTKDAPHYADCIVVSKEENGQVVNDTFYYDKYINLVDLINAPQTPYKNEEC